MKDKKTKRKIMNILNCSDVKNANANVDEYSFGGRKFESAGLVLKDIALNDLIDKKVAKAHKDNYIYIHDLDNYATGMHNCLFIDFKRLFENGFETRNGDVRPPRSISTAMQQMAVIMQCQSQVQFGGVASMHADYDLAPYVRYSFAKHYKDGLKYVDKFHIDSRNGEIDYEIEHMLDNPVYYSIKNSEYKAYSPTAYKYAIDMLEKEGKQSAQGLYHNLNTLESRAGSQLPFSSLNLGRDTSPEGRLITKWLLQASIDGIGKYHRTPIFPISIFQLKEGVNKNPGDPNYDLKLLALESTSKRLYPNYVNGDWSNVNEDERYPDTYMATMGAVAGFEHLYLKINGCRPIDISIEDFFNYCKTGELKNARPCQIFFSKEESNTLRDKPKLERNGYKSTGGVYSITYLPEDITYIGSTGNISRRFNEHRYNIRLHGGLDAGICFGDCNLNNYKFEVLEYTNTYEKQENKYIETIPNINYRGTSQRYYKNTHGNKIIHERPNIPQDYSIKQELIDLEDVDIKVLDRNNSWVKIKHIFKNDRRNSPLMMHIYYKEYDKTYCLTCTEDHPLWTGESFTRADNIKTGDTIYRADNLPLKVIDTSYHHTAVDSYDIGTYTGSFIISDVICHNCRTIVGSDRNGLGNVKVGRGNVSPITIVLPKLGIKHGICKHKRKVPDLKGFWKELDKILAITEKGLVDRYNYIAKQSPKSAPFMYKNGTAKGYDKCINNVEEMVKHGTNAIGMIGLAETLEALFGENHASERVREFGREIVERIYKYTLEASARTGLNFSCYFSPAENSCYTIMKKLKEEYGIIPKVTENEYLTNSIHVPVWEKVDVFDKINIESEFTKYGTGGCITYVEFDSSIKNNTKALEQVVDYAMEKDIPYLAINFPIDTCLDCGLNEEINDKCPRCGSNKIEHLARVTGYLSSDYRNFNKGKQQEVLMRFKHSTVTDFEE